MLNAEKVIRIAREHFGRRAYHVEDNPFLRSKASSSLSPELELSLQDLLVGSISAQDWLETDQAEDTLSEISVGCVPRDVQMVLRGGKQQIGVESVHAFADVPLFWWLISIAWCIEVGVDLDAAIDDSVIGYRMSSKFIDNPATSGQIFKNHKNSHKSWRGASARVAREHPGEIVTVATLDMKAFFYSVESSPSEILKTFREKNSVGLEISDVGIQLTELLNEAHRRYAVEISRLAPRGATNPASNPLPIGLPSSQVLGNLVIAVATNDLLRQSNIYGIFAYADDIQIVTPEMPNVLERPEKFFERMNIVHARGDDTFLSVSDDVRGLASFEIEMSKSEISYGRSFREKEVDSLDDEGAVEFFDSRFSSTPNTDWGGRLRTVLRSPFKRDRVPSQFAQDLRRLVDEIRIGLDRADASQTFDTLLHELDNGAFLALRSSWTDLAACALFVGGGDPVNILSNRLINIVDHLEPPQESSQALETAIRRGIKSSWGQSLAEALSIMRDAGGLLRDQLDEGLIVQATDGSLDELLSRSSALRNRNFIDAGLISMPLAEFAKWEGPLFGQEAFEEFLLSLGGSEVNLKVYEELKNNVRNSNRFIPLHEFCVALHLWVKPFDVDWLRHIFELFSSQPLLDQGLADQLQNSARKCLKCDESDQRALSPSEYTLRLAIPSLQVRTDQLDAIIDSDYSLKSEIARESRANVNKILKSAVDRQTDFLVFPEWAVLTPQLPWLFAQSASHQMFVVAGEAPTVTGCDYSNKVWTGIPVIDSIGHRSCLVPPPREKNYLSPEEATKIGKASLLHRPIDGHVPRYHWRGISIGSLICYEFADIEVRNRFRHDTDLITVSSLNKDWRYFGAIQESITRDNYCLTVCVNTGQFPGTQIMRPTSSDRAIAAAVHGSGDPSVVTRVIDLLPLVIARTVGLRPDSNLGFPTPCDDLSLGDYKALPPRF